MSEPADASGKSAPRSAPTRSHRVSTRDRLTAGWTDIVGGRTPGMEGGMMERQLHRGGEAQQAKPICTTWAQSRLSHASLICPPAIIFSRSHDQGDLKGALHRQCGKCDAGPGGSRSPSATQQRFLPVGNGGGRMVAVGSLRQHSSQPCPQRPRSLAGGSSSTGDQRGDRPALTKRNVSAPFGDQQRIASSNPKHVRTPGAAKPAHFF